MSERRQSIGDKIIDGIHHAAEYATGAIFNSTDDDNAAPNSMPGPNEDSGEKYGVKSASPEVSGTGAASARGQQMAH
uniref:Uncharacterized protein n=1 Tax=Panagrolaimus davidi TaxID=227884 RepID=A0A914QVB9_9BILA